MNPEYDSNNNHDDFVDELELQSTSSIDDFIRELEEKEKDLHISSEMVVEIEDVDFGLSEMDEIDKLIKTYQSSPQISPIQPPAPQIMPNQNDSQPVVSELEAEVTKLRSEIAKTSREKNEIQESFRRRQTDFENFRKRTDRERDEIFRSILTNLAVRILPVVDNLSRALDSSESSISEKSPDFQNFVDGIGLVKHQIGSVLEEMGIQPIESVGQPFDPHYHEAVATVPNDQFPHNTVIEELIRGYRIDNKVIRASMVKVSISANPELAPLTPDAI